LKRSLLFIVNIFWGLFCASLLFALCISIALNA
jgi:hypothetical protein